MEIAPMAPNEPGGSIATVGSFLSIGSVGSILSIGSVGSVLSIGSAGSVLSIASIGSVLSIWSIFSVGGFLNSVGTQIARPLRRNQSVSS
jgi:hypothetical protein